MCFFLCTVVTKCTTWIHPEQGALLRMCHVDDVLDPSGIICCLLDSVLFNGGNILIRDHQVMEMM